MSNAGNASGGSSIILQCQKQDIIRNSMGRVNLISKVPLHCRKEHKRREKVFISTYFHRSEFGVDL
jgi:hypothetical protein